MSADLIHDPNIVTDHSANSTAPISGLAWSSPDGVDKLYQGDALEVLARLPEESVDCVWTDPPYLLSNGGVTCVSGRMVSVNKGDWDRSRGIEADHEFNLAWTAACRRVLKPAGTLWVSGTLHVYPSVGMALIQNGFRLLNDIIWEKPNPPPNLGCRTFTHSTEVILWASKSAKGSRHRYTFNYEEMRRENGGKQMKTVWRMKAPSAAEKQFGKHPHAEADRIDQEVPSREHERRRRRPGSIRGFGEHWSHGSGARPTVHRHRDRSRIRRYQRKAPSRQSCSIVDRCWPSTSCATGWKLERPVYLWLLSMVGSRKREPDTETGMSNCSRHGDRDIRPDLDRVMRRLPESRAGEGRYKCTW